MWLSLSPDFSLNGPRRHPSASSRLEVLTCLYLHLLFLSSSVVSASFRVPADVPISVPNYASVFFCLLVSSLPLSVSSLPLPVSFPASVCRRCLRRGRQFLVALDMRSWWGWCLFWSLGKGLSRPSQPSRHLFFSL